MTPVSRYKLTSEDEQRVLDTLISELTKITEKDKLSSLLSLLLSNSERIMLAKRMAAFVMIEQEIPDSQVAKVLHLTRITVAKLRLTYLLAKEKKDPVVKIVQKPTLREIIKPLLKDFLLKYALPAAMGRIPK